MVPMEEFVAEPWQKISKKEKTDQRMNEEDKSIKTCNTMLTKQKLHERSFETQQTSEELHERSLRKKEIEMKEE